MSDDNTQENYEQRFAEALGWTYVEEQEVGVAVDFVDQDENRIEGKFDWQSIERSNHSHYLELMHTLRNEQNRVQWYDSGYRLAREQADYWMIVNDHTIWMFTIAQMDNLLLENLLQVSETHPLRPVQTNTGVSGNEYWRKSCGLSIPFELLDQYADSKMRNLVPRTHRIEVWQGKKSPPIELHDLDTSGCTCCDTNSRPYDD